MAVSKEVADAVERIRAMKNAEKADKEADKVREARISELEQKLDAAQAKLDAIPVNRELSEEDKAALKAAFDEVAEAKDSLTETHEELKGAAVENTETSGAASGGSSDAGGDPKKENIKPVGDEGHPTEPLTQGDVLAANGPANHPAGGSQPMMPNSAFDPDPTGATRSGGETTGQPAQPAAIETAGGFVIQGGGTTQRAPGSSPESPSSSQVVPLDPDAKAPASTADVVKSGLGDSSQNATIGNDLKPVDQGPGMPQEPTDSQREAAQKLSDAMEEERRRREENPLNLAPEGTPQAGSPDAEKAAREQALEDQRKGIEANKEKMGNPSSDSFSDEQPAQPAKSKEDMPNPPAS